MPNTGPNDYNADQLKRGAITLDVITGLTKGWQLHHDMVVDGMCGPETVRSVLRTLQSLPSPRCWPLRQLADGRAPVITSDYWTRNPDRAEPDRRHMGCDIMYKRLPTDPPMPIGDSGRTRDYWIPEGTIAVAQAAGDVELAGKASTGWRVWIRHANGYATGGFHFSQIFVSPGQSVRMGDRIGVVNDNPLDRNDPDHLHAELYHGRFPDYPTGSLDPHLMLDGADILPAGPQ